jgi:hypothetical protein
MIRPAIPAARSRFRALGIGLVVSVLAVGAVIAALTVHRSRHDANAGGLTAAEKSSARRTALRSPIVTQLAEGITVSTRNVFPLTGLIADDSFRGAAVVLSFSGPVRLPVGAPVLQHRSDNQTGPVLLADFATTSTSIGPAVRTLIVDVNASTGDLLAFAPTP